MVTQKILSAAMLAVLPAAALALPFTKATAEECRTKPGTSGAPGKHWYYRINRSDHQHCWYLGSARAEQGSHARRAISMVHRPLIRHRATEQADGDPQVTGSEQVTVQESLPGLNFALRWANWTSQDLPTQEIAAIGYFDAGPATDADQKAQFIGPVDYATNMRPQYVFGKIALGFLLFAGVLTITLPALAAGLLKLARAPPASDSDSFTTANQPRYYRRLRRVESSEITGGKLFARTQTGRSVWRSRMAPDPLDGFETDLQELMGALQRASAGPYTLRSFAPGARSRRSRRS